MMNSTSDWMVFGTLGQTVPEASAAAPAPAQPVRAVGMPGSQGSTGQPATAPGTPAGQPSAAPSSMMLWLILAMFAVMIVPAMLSSKREKKKREQLMSSLKKNDKVQTLGGIIGTITELSDKEVVLKVEDGRIRFARSAIQGVVQTATAPAGTLAEPKDAKTVSV